MLYGTGGIGKTTLGLAMPGPRVWLDLDQSLARLGKTSEKVAKPDGNWKELMSTLTDFPAWEGVRSVIIDSVTVAERLAVEDVCRTVRTPNGGQATSIEDYGYGKGYVYLHSKFVGLLDALDVHAKAGRNVLLIAHDVVGSRPNPEGDPFPCYMPRLYAGRCSNMERAKEWADHLLFINWDYSVDEKGRGHGGRTRTLYTSNSAAWIAKSRTYSEDIDGFDDDPKAVCAVWEKLIGASALTTKKEKEKK